MAKNKSVKRRSVGSNSSDMESQGFTLVANKTIAKGSSSWLDSNGRMHFKEIVPTGTPEFVKRSLGANNSGEQSELEFAHNTKVWEREIETPGTNGIIKNREVVIEQDLSVGDSAPTPASSFIPSDSIEPISENAPSGLQVLKNFVDKQADYLKWIAIGLAVVAVATGVLYGIVLA